jgi:transposase-like protein
MANDLQNEVFHDEAKARKWLERHLWADGRVCGYCGTVDNSTAFPAPREGYYQCNAPECRKQFTVQVGTLFERSHIPLNKWLLAAFLMACSKKGISTHQLHRMIGVSYKSTWFMTHRLREAMRDGKFPGPLGGEGKIVEADETWIGGKEANKHVGKRNNERAALGVDDKERAARLLKGIVGKRLTYRRPDKACNAEAEG